MNSKYFRVTNLILLLLIVVCSLKVVHTRHTARGLSAQIGRLDKNNRQLEIEYTQLLLEQSTWTAQGRIERLATEKLHMKHPELNQIIVLEKP
jgi:cell division protein FtsL